MSLSNQPLAGFLGAVAEPTPAPGGGSSAAVACALAAALVEMASAIGKRDGARARAIRERALELADEELSAYAPVLEARRLSRDDPSREERLTLALREASRSPLELAELAAQVAEAGAEVARASEPSVAGDAAAGVVLAEAAAAAAARLAEINLAGSGAGDLLERARAARRRAAAARESLG